MNIYKNGNKTYLTFPKRMTKDEVLKEANAHFKTKKSNLLVRSGKVRGYTLDIDVPGNVWVVSREVY